MINRQTVVGVFDDRDQAERAVDELRRLGFLDEQIGFATRGDQPEGTRGIGEGENQAGEGAATGAVSGGVIGGLIGAAISGLIPGIGPVIAGGILASVLGGAAVGAAAGGLFGALVGEGVPEEDARYYDEEFRGGRTIVTVRAEDRYDEAQNALRRFGAHDDQGRDHETETTRTTASTDTRSTSDMGTGLGTAATDWATANPRYRQSWERQYGSSGGRWEDYEPYYHYSYEMRDDPRYRGRNWSEVEPDLRSNYRDWATRSGYRYDESVWNKVKDGLRDAWDSLRGEGTATRDRSTSDRTNVSNRDRTDATNSDRMELREERLNVEKRSVEKGEARLRKEVISEEQSVDVPVRREEAYIERHAVSGDRPARGNIGEGEIRVPIREEVVDVEKETVVREEVELGKRTVQNTQRVSDTVRREEARVETTGDVKVNDATATGTHQHVYDENGNCLTCRKSRTEIERGRRAA